MINDPGVRYQEMIDRLKKRGCRLTSHRLVLLQLIARSDGHPTAYGLYEKLRIQFPAISLATVYKTLVLLKEEGELFELDLHGEAHYDGNKPYSHPHLVCKKCGKISDGEDLPAIEYLDEMILEKFGFLVSQQQQVFYGLCPDCR